MTLWKPTINTDSSLPIYVQIVDAIRADIRSGRLPVGTQLPTHRAMARTTGVTISTITRAFSEATRQHLVHAHVGRGTFVLGVTVDAALFATTFAEDDQIASARTLIDLASNVPAQPPNDHDLATALGSASLRRMLRSTYPTERGLASGQAVFADLLRHRDVLRRDEEVVLAAGAQQALLATLVVVAGAGSRVLVEELTFPGMKSVARNLNIQLVPVRMDDRGLDPRDLDRAASSSGATVLVTVACLQNPTTSTMDATRRDQIACVARRRGLTVIEDDVYGALQDEPALASTLPEATIIISSLSKVAAPALRLGAIAAPQPVIDAIRREVSLTSWTVSPPMIAVAARWAADGTLARRIQFQRAEIKARGALVPPAWAGDGSPHRWLPIRTNPDRAADTLRGQGVAVVSSTALATRARAPKGIRISITAAPDRATLHAAITRINDTPLRPR